MTERDLRLEFDRFAVEGDDLVFYEERLVDYHKREWADFEVARVKTDNGEMLKKALASERLAGVKATQLSIRSSLGINS